MSTPMIWLVIALVGLGTYALRVSFLHLHGRLQFPQPFQQGLRLVPAAVLTALVAPALVDTQELLAMAPDLPRLAAGLLALVVAWRFGNMALTLACGMGALWMLQALGAA